MHLWNEVRYSPIRRLLTEQSQVNFEYSLEKPHVGSLVQANLVLPDIYNKDFGRGEREKCGFALEILWRK